MNDVTSIKKRVGVYGTGYWAEAVHLPALRDSSEFVLSGIHGRNKDAGERLAALFGVPFFESVLEFLEAVEVVSFSVPPAAQAPAALQAALAGKDLILEKPVSLIAHETRAINDALREHSGKAVVHYSRLLDPGLAGWIAKAPSLGLVGAEIRIHNGAMLPGSNYAGSAWRGSPEGALWDLGPHAVSVATAVFGPVESAHASREPEGTTLALTHTNGATSTISIGMTSAEDVEIYKFTDKDGRTYQPGISALPGTSTYRALCDLLEPDSDSIWSPTVQDLEFSEQVVGVLEKAKLSLDDPSLNSTTPKELHHATNA